MTLFTPSRALVDAVINHPTVRPTVQQGRNRLSADSVFAEGAVLYADREASVALFLPLGPSCYEGHVFCLEPSRGAAALRFGKLAITKLFADHRPIRLVVPVPLQLPAARWYCRRLGLKSEGRDLFQEYFSTEAVQWVA